MSIQRRTFLSSAVQIAALLAIDRSSSGSTTRPVYQVASFGAKGDGTTKDTRAIQAALDHCARRGGGTVELTPGKTFLSGSLVLGSNVTLSLGDGCTLITSPDREDFLEYGSLIFARGAQNVSVAGTGTIDGNFHAYLKDRTGGGYRVTQPFLGPYDPLYGPERRNPPDGRPRMLLFVDCHQVQLRSFTIRDSPTWTIHPIGCTDLTVSHLTIRNNLEVPNCDGIDVDHCRNVRIEDCDFRAGDDCIVLKTSRNFSQYGPCEGVVVRNCVLESASAGVKIEPEGADTIRRASFQNCTVNNSNRGIAILNRDGAVIENMDFSNFRITTKLEPPMWWGAGEPLHISNLPRNQKVAGGIVRRIKFRSIECTGVSGVYLRGWKGWPVEDIEIEDAAIRLVAAAGRTGGYYDLRPGDIAGGVYPHTIAGIYCEQLRNLTLQQVSVEWGSPAPQYFGPALEAHDIQNLKLVDFQGQNAHPGTGPAQVLENVTRAR